MAGTDTPRSPAAPSGPAIILVEPQLGENIGACARAMLNCGLTDLRLVNPRDGWPNEKATAAASGATLVLDNVRLYGSTQDAIADLQYVYATTARTRDQVKPVFTPRSAASDMRARAAVGQGVGVLFGRERTGLENDDVALADAVITVPLNPSFMSLNLAQAVLLLGYEWFQLGDATPGMVLHTGDSAPATKEVVENVIRHLEEELDRTAFIKDKDKKPSMMRNIRNAFNRMAMTDQEARTFHGIIVSLTGRRRGGDPLPPHPKDTRP